MIKTKQELKAAYAQMKFDIGVFQIRNTVNEKIFVGSSMNLHAIWNRERLTLNFGGHNNQSLQEDWKTYGEEIFRYEIVAQLEQKDGDTEDFLKKELKMFEKMYIEELQPFGEKGYNRKSGK